MFEIVAGELRAKLGTVSAMRQVRSGCDTCAVAGPGRAIHSDLAPLVWRAPEGPAAVLVGGGGAWPAPHSTTVAAGVEGAGGHGGHGRASRRGAERSEDA